jgi:hypothetical protein
MAQAIRYLWLGILNPPAILTSSPQDLARIFVHDGAAMHLDGLFCSLQFVGDLLAELPSTNVRLLCARAV